MNKLILTWNMIINFQYPPSWVLYINSFKLNIRIFYMPFFYLVEEVLFIPSFISNSSTSVNSIYLREYIFNICFTLPQAMCTYPLIFLFSYPNIKPSTTMFNLFIYGFRLSLGKGSNEERDNTLSSFPSY
jgi:hypothetical protein